MAFDEALAARIRDALARRRNVEEKTTQPTSLQRGSRPGAESPRFQP